MALGRSQEKLLPLLAELETIDLFIHDSEHANECMTFEYEQAYPRLRPGGILAAHDIDGNPSCQDFALPYRKKLDPHRPLHGVLGEIMGKAAHAPRYRESGIAVAFS